MSIPIAVRPYFVGALENGPLIVSRLLGSYGPTDPIWDFRPYADRFTLREVIAHMADWNPIYRSRIERTRDEEMPQLEDCDEGKIAIERDYASSNPVANLQRYIDGRPALVNIVAGIKDEDWSRKAIRHGVGEIDLGELIALVSAHDAFHIRQVCDYQAKWTMQPVGAGT